MPDMKLWEQKKDKQKKDKQKKGFEGLNFKAFTKVKKTCDYKNTSLFIWN